MPAFTPVMLRIIQNDCSPFMLMVTNGIYGCGWKGFALHAFTEPGERAGLLLVPTLSEPALDGPHVPVQLLGQALQSLLIWVLTRQDGTPHFSDGMKPSKVNDNNEAEHMRHLGYSSENLLQDGVGLGFLRPVGLDLQSHGTWSCYTSATHRHRLWG